MTAGGQQPRSGDGGGAPAIGSLRELMVHAVAMETEAEQRYHELADQMETHNNPEVASLFRLLAGYEGRQARQLGAEAAEMGAGALAPWQYAWPAFEAPENADPSAVHYLMTPTHALRLALEAERRAHAFYREIADTASAEALRSAAEEMAAEEAQHIELVQEMLAKYPEPAADWDDDPDPPVEAE